MPEAAREGVAGDLVETEAERSQSILVDPPKQKEPEKKEPPDYQKIADRLGNDLGTLRKENAELRDQLQAFIAEQSKPPPEDPASFQDDPDKWLEQKLGTLLDDRIGPKLQVLESDLQRRANGEFEAQMNEAAPDWEETVNSQEFRGWVEANPGMRHLVAQAAQAYDVQAGLEAIRRFKQDMQAEKRQRQGAFGDAAMSSGGSGEGAAKTYSASEIQNLQLSDPEGYRRWLSADGYAAYREGRVKRGL